MFHIQFPKLGLNFTVNRIAFSLFGIDVYWYGLIIAVGCVLMMLVAFNLAERRKINTDKMVDVIIVSSIAAIIGARIYYVAFGPIKYDSFWAMMNIRDGGIGIYGGVIAGLIVAVFACKWKKIDALEFCDVAASCFLLGQGIGRWGNFVNQEAFGSNTDNMFGMISEGTTRYLESVKDKLALQGVIVDPNMPVHPTFLYESVWCLIGFVLMIAYFNRKKFKGEMLCIYAIWYGFGRFFIEGLRTDSLATSGGIKTSQIIAVVTVVASIGIIVYNRVKQKNKVIVDENLDKE